MDGVCLVITVQPFPLLTFLSRFVWVDQINCTTFTVLCLLWWCKVNLHITRKHTWPTFRTNCYINIVIDFTGDIGLVLVKVNVVTAGAYFLNTQLFLCLNVTTVHRPHATKHWVTLVHKRVGCLCVCTVLLGKVCKESIYRVSACNTFKGFSYNTHNLA